MKKLSLATASMLMIFNFQSAFGSCEKEVKAIALINAVEKYQPKFLDSAQEAIDDSKKSIEEGTFCEGFKGYLTGVHLCTTITGMAGLNAISTGDFTINAKDPKNQKALEKALQDYGNLFYAVQETVGRPSSDSFSCNLKTLKYGKVN
jgi:hypothetical protein